MHTHTQSYCMHLKSSNGPIDVLVCPEGDDQRLNSPCPSIDSENATSTPLKTGAPPHHPSPLLEPTADDRHSLQLHCVAPPPPHEDLDISLSSAADVGDARSHIEDLIQDYDPVDLEGLDASGLLHSSADAYNFHCLSPTLPAEDFCFGLDGAEGIAELFDLV